MKYNIGLISKSLIRGWCFNENKIEEPVVLDLYIDDIKIAKEIANISKKDLYDKGVHPTGLAGFKFNLKEVDINSKSKIKIKVYNADYNLNLDKAYKNFIDNITTLKKSKNNKFEKHRLCIVHIGMHKTGSSSIQHNLSKVKSKNFHYFNIGSINHSIPIYSMFSNNKYSYYVHKKNGLNDNAINNYNLNVDKNFKQNVNTVKKDIFILSGEDIIFLTFEELTYFKKYLYKYFYTVKIVAYVRSPMSYLSSAVQQVIKGGATNLQKILKAQYPKYKDRFDKFDTVFAKENVALHFFSKSNLINNDITTDFLYRQKLKMEEKKFSSTNESMSLEAIALLYIFNQYSSKPIANPKGAQAKQKLLKALQSVGSKKFLLSKEYIQKVVDYDKDDLLWIENRMNMKISDEESYSDCIDSIASEEDLYEAAKTVIKELKSIIGNNQVTKDVTGDSPKDIAKLMDLLYEKLYEQQ